MAITIHNEYPAYNYESNVDPVTVGASPFILTNTNAFSVRVFITGAVTALEYKQAGWPISDYQPCIIVTNTMMDLNPLDALRITYVVAPTIKWCAR